MFWANRDCECGKLRKCGSNWKPERLSSGEGGQGTPGDAEAPWERAHTAAGLDEGEEGDHTQCLPRVIPGLSN